MSPSRWHRPWTVALVAVLLSAGVLLAFLVSKKNQRPEDPGQGPGGQSAPANPGAPPPAAATDSPTPAQVSNSALPTLEAFKSVMVTVALDFEPPFPTIAEALRQIERRHEPEDGAGRTFAVLDADGGPTSDGQKLHVSMHLSAEKPGIASLVFRPTGEILWKNRIIPAKAPPTSVFKRKQLMIMVDDEKGREHLLDGSKAVDTIFEATVRSFGVPLEAFWPEGEERRVTFFYSTCGCPVKVLARRVGFRTARTKKLPVIFPDDPSVAATIARLMGW